VSHTGPRWPLLAASLLGATGVMAGAFGAHGLASRVSPERLEVWQTAATYQLFHSIALLALALSILYASNLTKKSTALWVCRSWLLGVIIFSGSLYGLVLSGITWLGAITPIGGTLLIVGWVLLSSLALGGAGASADNP
jgi:uncharacterized membrane protein YgdD (TMEM256/DUF423 family)